MNLLSLDPGLRGGGAVLKTGQRSKNGTMSVKLDTYFRMPTITVNKRTAYDLEQILSYVEEYGYDHVAIEGVTRPASLVGNKMFLYGCAMAQGATVITVPAQNWKKGIGLLRGKNESLSKFKQRSIALANDRLGTSFGKSDDGVAEAALIGLYCIERGLV